jgi:hypothetical protein
MFVTLNVRKSTDTKKAYVAKWIKIDYDSKAKAMQLDKALSEQKEKTI